jgi:uncharacterized protein with NRDE domain
MCLVIAVSGLDPDLPLVVAANRDERLDRPARAMTVLQVSGPRILGGRDERAGGTWLAVNEHGMTAALTNRPSPGGPDPAKRSRGALPLALVQHGDAESAVADLVRDVDPEQFNPAWLLVGDRRTLHFVELAGADGISTRPLGPGLHVLENRAVDDPSPKVTHVRALVGDVAPVRGAALVGRLREALRDHRVPPGTTTPDGSAPDRPALERDPRAEAACVHLEEFGTRCATLVQVPAADEERPAVAVADGPPCRTPFVDVSAWWSPVSSHS